MGQRMKIKEAASYVGLSEWELRQGIRSGRYPALRVGVGKGKYIVDIDLLETRIKYLMEMNIRSEDLYREEAVGKIRSVM